MKSLILDTIEQYDTIIIHRHVRPDPDALGSQGGLSELLKTSYPDKNVYVVGEEDKELTFLCKMDQIADETFKGALVIICDTANQPRISDQRYKLGEKIIKIDHHPNEDPYGDIVWVDTSASSVSEMIYDFYVSQKERGLLLTQRAARLLYAGIIGDTGRFLFSNTTKKTFQYAGELIHTGIEFREIYENLYKRKLELVYLNGYVLQNFTLTESGAGYIKLTQEILNDYGIVPSEASLLVNAFSEVEGLKAWVFFIEEKDQIRVRLRSKGPVVNTIAARYEGGGHPMAAGATIYKWEQVEDVLRDLEEVCYSYV
jgi:bifunctional oligoribonuclease and PAP phosphatase NrnA